MKAGFIGLGHMGNGMSKNVLKANGQLLVSDLSDDAKALLKAEGADVAENNAQVAQECDVIFLSLPMPAHVRSVASSSSTSRFPVVFPVLRQVPWPSWQAVRKRMSLRSEI